MGEFPYNHQTKFLVTLLPDQVTYASNKKAWWQCPVCDHEWNAVIVNRSLHKRGCPVCGRNRVTAYIGNLFCHIGNQSQPIMGGSVSIVDYPRPVRQLGTQV